MFPAGALDGDERLEMPGDIRGTRGGDPERHGTELAFRLPL